MAEDRFTSLPQGIIQNILCLVPIQEAARTSILSREWMHHWTKIPNLVFNENTFEVAGDELTALEETYDGVESDRRQMTHRSRFFSAIYQTLLKHEGPILEFTMWVDADVTCVEIDHILAHLATKNSVEKLTLTMEYKLPSSILRLEKLTDLCLYRCDLIRKPQFNGFPSLRNLYVEGSSTTKSTIIHILSRCPSLKILTLDTQDVEDDDDSTLQDLFACLAGIEYLSTYFLLINDFVVGRVIGLPISLLHLKEIFIHEMVFRGTLGLPLLYFLMRSSPMLETFKLEMSLDPTIVVDPIHAPGPFDSSGILLRRLHLFEMQNVRNEEGEMDFVRLIMARSPVLECVRIFSYAEDAVLDIERILFEADRASPNVEMTIA